MSGERPTIANIAVLAAVSRGTVDRALHDRRGVNPAVAQSVRRIARELGYVPNRAAKALKFNNHPKTLVVILPTSNREYFDQLQRGVLRARQDIKDMGIAVDVVRLDCDHETAVAQAIDRQIANGAAGVALTGPDTVLVREAIDRAVAAGVPVITVNSDVTGSRRLCFVGQDLKRSGLVAAELLSKMLNRGGRVIAVTGNLTFRAHADRIVGFRVGIARWSTGLHVEVREGFGSYRETFGCMQKALVQADRDGENVVGIYMATGVNQACIDIVRERQLAGKVRVVTNDDSASIRAALRSREVDFTICQDPIHQGYTPLRILSDYLLSGERPACEWYRSPIQIVGESNLTD